jgi:hypothetical protein
VAPWWEELDAEAFRFPAAREVRPAQRAVARADVGEPRAVARADAGEPRAVAPRPAAAARNAGTRSAAPAVSTERRTVAIRGRGPERNLPVARPTLRRHERPGFRPDRAALWAVILGLVLILVAVASAHGAVLHH